MVSYSVNRRVQKIGIRMAPGASATDLQGRILLHTLGLALGLSLGLAVARLLTSGLEGSLFGVMPGDPLTFPGMGALLLVVAGYSPRASRIDPIVALRAS